MYTDTPCIIKYRIFISSILFFLFIISLILINLCYSTDCAVLGSRLVLRPEPLAWALTDGQLRAALACAAALADPVRKATQMATRTKAAHKVRLI